MKHISKIFFVIYTNYNGTINIMDLEMTIDNSLPTSVNSIPNFNEPKDLQLEMKCTYHGKTFTPAHHMLLLH